ncbi:FAD-dependent oxidoreductase [Pseudonocardia sp. CA-142604]|uniref:FAD-dependent oxidoreductase n=1 Tax=Pseudonocardia sp. CA-142604 TaxID=3240024 RepID=UPI003D8F95EF
MRTGPRQVFAQLSSTCPPAHPVQLVDTAVVLGGSVAGLLAARVLADHARSVLIIERDAPTGGGRRGVPHGLQIHLVLAGGRVQIERWFPGFGEQAAALGAVLVDPAHSAAFSDGQRRVNAQHDVVLSCSRPFLENQLRVRALALPNVRLLTGQACGLDIDATAVTGVRYRRDGVEHAQPAGLVVDAMGRASRLSDWLEHAGWQRPPLRRVPTDVDYATGFFSRKPGLPDVANVIARHRPGSPVSRVGIASLKAIEDDRWQITLACSGEHRTGRDDQEFVALCKSELPSFFGEAVNGEPVGPIETFHHSDSRRRDFCADSMPARLVGVGDAVASFNPVYGQGLSAAALHASCLAAYLQSSPRLSVPARSFFAMQKVVVDAAWEISTAADKARHHLDGSASWRERLGRWIRAEVQTASATDVVVARRFRAVTVMLEHPAALYAPRLVARAALVNVRNRLADRPRGRRHTPGGHGTHGTMGLPGFRGHVGVSGRGCGVGVGLFVVVG